MSFMDMLVQIWQTLLTTITDVLPIAAILFGFQFAIIRKPIPNVAKVLAGFVWVLVGLSLFLIGLEWALFPLGKLMAQQLTDPVFISGTAQAVDAAQAAINLDWKDYIWVYIFAFLIGFSTTIAEPSFNCSSHKSE